ncbi:MAG: carbohydrate ABC transporter permease [Chloroflexota bacterium]
MGSWSMETRAWRITRRVLVLAALAFFLFPVYWLLATSLQAPKDVFTAPPKLVFQPTLDNFASVWRDYDVADYLRNSIVIAAGSTALSLVLGVPAAYALARTGSPGLQRLAWFFLVVRMVPPIAMLLPLYLLMRDLRVLGTYQAVIVVNTVLNSAFVVWMLRAVFAELPIETEEAARCDGASRWGTFWRVALPLARPGIIASALFCILFSWNDFLFALLLTSPATKTLPVALLATFSSTDIVWGQLAVMSIITVLPVVLAAIALNRKLVQGLTGGVH